MTSLALALAGDGWRVALAGQIDQASSVAPDIRAYALNARSIALLERLRVWPQLKAWSTPVESIIDALNEHVRAGKVRHLGCSNWRTARVRAANAYAETSGQSGFIANQPMWNAAVIAPAQVPDQTLV